MGGVSFLSPERQVELLRLMQISLSVQTHFQLLLWLQGEFQEFLQHDILISVSGDFAEGTLHYDIVSPLPGVRTEVLAKCSIARFCREVHERWLKGAGQVTEMEAANGFAADGCGCVLDVALRSMRHAVFHGILDARTGGDHLYILLRREKRFDERSRKVLGLLLPHIDAAARKIEGLPELQPDQVASRQLVNSLMQAGLTPREIEILEWVRNGKTNIEIGLILDISAFTVKNHLQRIFKKMNVTNRAHAVAEMERVGGGEGLPGAAAERRWMPVFVAG